MARLWTCNFGLNSLTAGVELSNAGGTGSVAVVNSPVHSGSTSLQCKPASTAALVEHSFASSGLTIFFRCYLYVVTFQAAGSNMVIFRENTGTNVKARIQSSGSGIRATNSAGTQVGSDVPLNTGQWYRVEFKLFVDSSVGTIDLLVDGVSKVSVTGVNTGATNVGNVRLGVPQTTTTGEFYFADVAINDASGGSQNSYPGAGNTVYCQPNGAGDSNQWTVQVGGTAGSSNNYTRVNEAFPPDDVTTYNGELIATDTDDYTITVPAAIGANDTINVVHVGCRYRAVVAAAEAAFKLRLKSAASGTVTSSAEITPNSTTWKTNANADPITYPITSYTDPTTTVAWTKTGTNSLTNAQIGMIISTQNTNAADISTIWMVVDYVPATVGRLVGVGQAVNRASTY